MSSHSRRPHGGKREGAGRPPVSNLKEQHTITVSLTKFIKDKLDEFVREAPGDVTRSSVVREALRRFLKL